MVGFHRKVSLLYCRVYNLTLSLERNMKRSTVCLAVISRLESSSFPPLEKYMETKNNDFQVQNLFWGPPIVWFHGTPGFSRGFFGGNRGRLQRRTSAFRRSLGSFDGATRSEGWWKRVGKRKGLRTSGRLQVGKFCFFPHYCNKLFMGSGQILGWLLKLGLYS